MTRIRPALLLAACLGIAGQTGVAKEIYTWTDENGIVHYVDTPPANPDAKAVDAPEAYRPGSVSAEASTDGATLPEGGEAAEGEAVQPELSAADAKRQELAEQRARRQAEQARREALCAEATRRLAMVEPTRRVYYQDEQGETVRLDDEERVRLVEEYKTVMEQNCD